MDSIRHPLYVSVSAVIGSMQAELDTLAQRKTELERRLRNLRKTWHALRATQAEASSQLRRSRRRLRRAWKVPGADKSQNLYEELRRACRIALLEAEGPATPDQIHASIIRRGSFAFEVLDEEPIAAILRMLKLISDPREAGYLTNASSFAVDVHPESTGMT
jgi:hypothetical protein